LEDGGKVKFFQSWLDKLWELSATRGAEKILMGVSFTEAIFFPVPPDLLLIPMGLAKREKAFRLAFICLAASLVGGIVGYVLGYFFMGRSRVLNFYGGIELYQAFTKSKRDYIFDLMGPDNNRYTDMFLGIKIGWMIPVNRRYPEKYYYY
jgi:membrane protein YqaA with SNARE-associated domain